ncbi:MAG: cytochrome P450 [Pyrinomonadaceae bacterium]
MVSNLPPIWNPFETGYLEDPLAHLRLLREQNPVHKGINGRWLFLKYDDVKHFLTNPIFKTVKVSKTIGLKSKLLSGNANFDRLSEISAKWMLFFEPPEHTELRSQVARIWNKYDATEIIRETVEECLALLAELQTVDIIRDFASFIPSRVVCKLLGLPAEDYFKLRRWSYCFNSMLEPFTTLNDFTKYEVKAREFYDYLGEIIRQKSERPDEAFVSQLLEANQDFEKPMNQSEIISVIAFMFFAGIETSINLFGESVLLLLKNPLQAQILREDDSITANAVEELLRFVSPSQYTTRVLAEDVEIREQKIKAGEFVMGATISANHDEDIFEDAAQLDFRRTKNPHLSFGFGLHYCLGARLARLETFHSLPALIKRFPAMRLNPDQKYQWDKIIINRGLKTLPVFLS